ncbi:hypothetical protein HMPREF1315_0348 [Bifidobacterium longum subsp. longum 2-2B]|uniref:Transposase n=1 Tax=Bifidobacterium longum subsp. longum 2-2B TaxID=1161745 RepID=A0AAV3FLQ8_BIFLL|nr:hypothetical protein HMPREF1315_0348 [Bifidobacterium longum subsp. longum 2-2B]
MAFDETYNEPESTEVLVKSLDPDIRPTLHYAHRGRMPVPTSSPPSM